jgi:predicted TIM-barrel fold metal-dependent hydrolase
MSSENGMSRRSILKELGLVSALPLVGSTQAKAGAERGAMLGRVSRSDKVYREIAEQVRNTPFVDTHEHLMEEKTTLAQKGDWTLTLGHYLASDFLTAGMPAEDHKKFFSSTLEPKAKWQLLAPYWPFVKNTGYGQAAQITLKELYHVEELSGETVEQVQIEFERLRHPGFYHTILKDICNIESCQVNFIGRPFSETDMPLLLMQDISILGMIKQPNSEEYVKPTGIQVKSLADWHRVMDWWFEKYGQYAVAVKSQNAYSRNIDYDQVSTENAEPIFKEVLAGERLTDVRKKALEDHNFWYAVRKATEHHLPVKLHTGYYAGQNINLPLWRLRDNAPAASDLCRKSPETDFIFMHINYPYYEELIALAKHYTNAHVDMCWSWIINPLAAKDFLKKYLVAAPSNKLLSFGGDYFNIEPIVGHAALARQGISLALTELVEEGWLNLATALDLAEDIMRRNARKLFRLDEKERLLKSVPWSRL